MSKPPVAVHGNYYGYYNKRASAYEPRLSLLPENFFKNRRVLDVGCNEGWVSCEIAQRGEAQRVVGVDIDEGLVRAAWKRRRVVWSMQGPPKDVEDEEVNGTRGVEVTNAGTAHAQQAGYFPAAMEHMFGPLPIPPAPLPSQDAGFPHNITFYAADWVEAGCPEDVAGYDIVLGLSVTKWIHLNGGDEGLNRFFKRVYDVLRPGGQFVLEPQEWEGYAKAKRLDAKLKRNAQSLQLRPDDFSRVLEDIGFAKMNRMGTAGEGGFRRHIDVYDKPVAK